MNANEPSRPDPDALLAEAKRQARGRLKVFLGMCPGVGKTYTMLRAAQQERAAGTDLIVGVVESLTAGYIDPYVGGGTKDFAPYLLMIVALMFRPYGLFGQRKIERV